MASRYWVGGSGTWDASDTTHWSASSGGAGGAGVPTSADDVFVDALSGTSPVITQAATANCLSLNFTGAITPTLAGNFALNVFGSLTFIPTMTTTRAASIKMAAISTGKTITTAGLTLFGLILDGVGGGWTFQDNVTVTNTVRLTNGTLNTNGKTITCDTFDSDNSNVRTLTLGASLITCSFWALSTTTNLTFTANTATITMNYITGQFAGGGLTYSAINFTGALTTVLASNTFTAVTILKGKTVKLTSGTNQTITTLVCNGTTASPSTLQSVTAGSAATITLPAGRYFIRHTSIKDITISGATAVTSIAGTNVSGNTGITFVTKFEMGRIKNDGSFNWYNSTTGTVTKVSG